MAGPGGEGGLDREIGARLVDHLARIAERGAAEAEAGHLDLGPPSGRVPNGSMLPCAAFGSLRQENALAGGLGVEQLVGLIGLVEGPALREQAVDVDLPIGDEAAHSAWITLEKVQGADHRQLLMSCRG